MNRHLDHLVDVAATTYQMQSWQAADRCTCDLTRRGPNGDHGDDCPFPTTTHSWIPMEDGAAAARWKPKPDAREAVLQAARWTGATSGAGGFPAMQVVEIPSGRVIWRDSAHYPDAGAPVAPPWQAEVYAAAQAEHRTARNPDREERSAVERSPERRLPTTHGQGVLF